MGAPCNARVIHAAGSGGVPGMPAGRTGGLGKSGAGRHEGAMRP